MYLYMKIGGEVALHGLRGESKELTLVQPKVGRAMLHCGQHIHEVRNVSTGERHMLVIWFRSSSYRTNTCPCCVINRRNSCICQV